MYMYGSRRGMFLAYTGDRVLLRHVVVALALVFSQAGKAEAFSQAYPVSRR